MAQECGCEYLPQYIAADEFADSDVDDHEVERDILYAITIPQYQRNDDGI